MLASIVARLKTGRVTRGVPYGSSLPAPPYFVVKNEPTYGGMRYRVTYHFKRDQQDQLEDALRAAMILLNDFQVTSRHGCTNRLGRGEVTTGIIDGNSDDTISMEAAFIMPTHTF